MWVALDHVRDPQNLGSIARSACFMGCSGLLLGGTYCAPPTAVAAKASSGALEELPLYECSDLAAVLHHAAEQGWEVVGADSSGLVAAADVRQFQLAKATVLVIGSEGEGIAEDVQSACTSFVTIPGAYGV